MNTANNKARFIHHDLQSFCDSRRSIGFHQDAMTLNQSTDRSFISVDSHDNELTHNLSVEDGPIFIQEPEETIPNGATTTCLGSRVIQGVIEPIAYQASQTIDS